jgi:site-specific DNA-methyltransferase (adenine-specific)
VNAVPFAGKKKGADSGIDGLIYFKPEGKATEWPFGFVQSAERLLINPDVGNPEVAPGR